MRLNEFLGIKYPIIQGGMANIALGEFAAAVSNAGGLGLIASGGFDAERIREEIRKCRALTDKPFGVNREDAGRGEGRCNHNRSRKS